jgi:hypothetical protein
MTKKQRKDGEVIANDCNKNTNNSRDNESVRLWYPEVYPNVPKNVFDEQNIPQFGPRFIFKDRVRQLTTGPALLHFLKRGYKVSIRRADGSVYPCLYELNNGELLNYGHRYPMHTILADAKLLHNDRVHAPISTSHKAANIIVLTQRYKQIPAKIDAVVEALDTYNSRSNENMSDCEIIHNHFGKFNGRITIMGSGGSHKVLGNFSPMPKCSKYDAQVEVGAGQTRTTAINQKLEGLASTQSVQAIFLNENYYYGNSETMDYHGDSSTAKTLCFLGYYEFFESRFVVGDHHAYINKEFRYLSDKLWQFLTFRLHPHLQTEARPFISNIDEVHRLQKNANSYLSVVVNEDDHSEIHYDNVTIADWMNGNHTVSIENVIDWLINSEQIKQHLVANNKSEISTTNDRKDTENDNKDVTMINNDQEL